MNDLLNSIETADSVSMTTEIHVDSSIHVADTFFQPMAQEILPLVNDPVNYSYFIYLMISLLFIVAIIWYMIPERLTYAFSISVKPDTGRLNEKESPAPGAIVTSFFLFNSVICMSFLLYFILKNVFAYHFEEWSYWKAMLYIAAILSSVYVLKMMVIGIAGWIFNTMDMAKKQARMYFNSNITLGVILLPLIFVLVIIPSLYLLYSILFITSIVFLIRWVQVIRLGISISHFNFFHLILYLCTLEIIPVVVLVKIFM